MSYSLRSNITSQPTTTPTPEYSHLYDLFYPEIILDEDYG